MKSFTLLFLVLLCSTFSHAQVGINATGGIDPSAALEIRSGTTPRGLLTPRMTTAERLIIAAPADGLIVYDTDLKSFYHYKAAIVGPPAVPAAWIRMSSDVSGRLNFKRIKSTDVLGTVLKDELTAGGGAKYKLNTNTLYEINGTVTFNFPIDLNNAYVQGLDSGEDKIEAAGNIFDGSTGGTIKGLTLVSTAGKVFNLSGLDAKNQNLIVRDGIIANSLSVGTINNFGLVFLSTIQFSANTTGITYSNISQLLLDKMGWFGDNLGTFEKLSGTFKLVQKQGGFSEVNGTAIGFDVSENPSITGDAVMESVVFTGILTGIGSYVKGYTTGSYTGYNFTEKWTVRCAGIPTETDAVAVGDVNLDLDYGVGTTITLSNNNTTAVKIGGPSTSNDFFRASNGDGQTTLKYLGNKKRFFTVDAVASFRGTAQGSTIYVFYIARNGTIIPRSKTYIFTSNANDVVAVPVQSIVEMAPNDTVDVRVTRYSGSSNMLLVSLSLFMR